MYKLVLALILLLPSSLLADLNFNLVGSKQEEDVGIDFSILGKEQEKTKAQSPMFSTQEGIEYAIIVTKEGKKFYCPLTFPANTKGWVWSQKDQCWWKEREVSKPTVVTTPIQQVPVYSPPIQFFNGGGGGFGGFSRGGGSCSGGG